MAEYVDPLENPQKNRYGTACLILGALSVAFAQFCHAPGVFSAVGCLGPVLGLAAAVTGIVGIRKARRLRGLGQKSAVGGLVTAMIAVWLFLVKFIPVMLTPGGVLTQLAAVPTLAVTSRPTLTPTPTPTPTATPLPTNTPASVTYQGRGFAITFTDEWITADAGSDSRTEYLVLRHSQDGIQLHVYRQMFSAPPDLEAEVASFTSNNFGAPNIIAEGEIEISGRKGITKHFVSDATTSRNHALMAAVVDGNDLYIFLVLASSEEELALHQDEALQIMASTEFMGVEPTAPPSSRAELQPYDGEVFALMYPGDWAQFDAGEVCQRSDVYCLGIRHPDSDGPVVVIYGQVHSEPPDLATIDQDLWSEFAGAADLVSEEDIVIGGEPAIKRVFSVPSSSSPSGRVYLMIASVVHENTSLQMMANTLSAEDMMRYQSALDDIIASIEFTE